MINKDPMEPRCGKAVPVKDGRKGVFPWADVVTCMPCIEAN